MGEALEIARSLGLGGLGLLAAVLSVRLAVQVVELARARERRRNGNGSKPALDELRLVCPVSAASHSLDDVHEVLVEIRAGMERLADTQHELATDMKERSHRLEDVLNAIRLELARREG